MKDQGSGALWGIAAGCLLIVGILLVVLVSCIK